jgi:hypothetical protein
MRLRADAPTGTPAVVAAARAGCKDSVMREVRF